jgi:hypothetical protein
MEAKERVGDSLTGVDDLLTGSEDPTVHKFVTNQKDDDLLWHLHGIRTGPTLRVSKAEPGSDVVAGRALVNRQLSGFRRGSPRGVYD